MHNISKLSTETVSIPFFKTIENTIVSYKSLFLFSILLIGLFLSTIIPPLQSPDENTHIERAYLLRKGVITLETPTGMGSGGYVDDGLHAYTENYLHRLPFHYNQKETRKDLDYTKAIRWSHTVSFSTIPGTGYNFPLVYSPSALGLLVGEQLDLTIDQSYRLARLFSFAACIVLLVAAFNFFPTNFLVIGILILPMFIFQSISTTIDGLSTSLSVLSISLFMRGANKDYAFPNWMVYLLAGCILAACRMHLTPFLLFLPIIYHLRRQKIILWASIVVALFWAAWTINCFSIVDPRTSLEFSKKEIASYYLGHPFAFINVIMATLNEPNYADFYGKSFIGILGWLDTPFEKVFYNATYLTLTLLAAFSFSLQNITADYLSRITLLSAALISVVLIFFSLLVACTPFNPASVVQGIQGRYFFVPVIMLGYALSGNNTIFTKRRAIFAMPILYTLMLVITFLMTKTLVARYFLVQS
jgi:uncharacterized membrane protein